MATLRELLGTGDKRAALIDDSLRVLEAEVDDKSGLSGIAIKTAFKVVKGISPGFLRQELARPALSGSAGQERLAARAPAGQSGPRRRRAALDHRRASA